MNIDLRLDDCDKCDGIEKCTKNCTLHTGKALVDFINRVDMIETRIGEYSSRERNTRYDLVVSGHQIHDITSPSWILTDIDTILDASSKFADVDGKTPLQIVNSYGKHVGLKSTDIKDINDKIKKINKNKLIVLPFKPHTSCSIDYTVGNNTEKNKEAEITYLKWTTNKETHKLECIINFAVHGATTTNIKMDIKEYMNKFKLSQMDINVKSNKYDKRLIKVSDYGIFHPVVVKEKSVEIAIDGTYMYCANGDDVQIIGYWDANDKLKIIKELKAKAFLKIKDNADYIKRHKKYMAPYLMFEPNIIEIK